MKKFLYLLLGGIILMPFNASALEFNNDSVVTENGAVLSLENYNRLSERYSDESIDNLPIEIVEFFNSDSITIIDSSNSDDLLITPFSMQNYQNNSKYIELNYYYDDGVYVVEFFNNWKVQPAVKSFDLIGVRWTGNPDIITAYGQQVDASVVNYGYRGTNMVVKSNGIGISMNLLDNCTTPHNNIIVMSSAPFGGVFASYQHAASTVTRDESKSYTFSSSGYGSVFKFNSNSVGRYYDAMPGVYVSSY